jgi:hypothetical protein
MFVVYSISIIEIFDAMKRVLYLTPMMCWNVSMLLLGLSCAVYASNMDNLISKTVQARLRK